MSSVTPPGGPSPDSLEDFAVSPTELVGADEISPEEREALEQRDEDNPTVQNWRTIDYPRPEPHGQGIVGVLEDLSDDRDDSTYKRLWRGWREHVGDRDHEPYVVLEDVHHRFDWLEDQPAHLCLKSKGWKAQNRYEYDLRVIPYDPEADGDGLQEDDRLPVSFQMWVQPQNEELQYKDGNNLEAPYGEGSRFKVQTTYAEPTDCLARVRDVLNAALPALDRDAPDWSTLNADSLRMWKTELYHRVLEKYMSAVVHQLRSLKTIVEYGGSGGNLDGHSDYYQGAHVEEVVISDMWEDVGFIGEFARRDGFDLGLKIYRLRGDNGDERLQHPKVEAFLESTDGTLPHIDEWAAMKSTLRQMVNSVCVRSGISLGQLVEDDFYEVEVDEEDRVDTVIPEGWRQAAREANEERERRILEATYEELSAVRWDIMYSVCMMDGASYDQLEELTGYTRDYIREIVAELEHEDVLMRLTYPRIVVFPNEELRLNAAEKLQEVRPGRDMFDIKADADDRREDRRQRREERDDQEASDDVQKETDAGDDLGPAADRRSSTWELVENLEFSAQALGQYLANGDIEPGDAMIRTDPYDWLG